jgi:protein SCO1/2
MGKDYAVVTVSFDPEETPALARAKKEAYDRKFGLPGMTGGWHFLTGEEAAIRKLADAVGFGYAYDPVGKQYMHPSVVTVLTPAGKVSRYLFGIRYEPKDLKTALAGAAGSRIASPVERVITWLCGSYDPVTGTYRFTVMNAVRLAGVVTVLGLATWLVMAWCRTRRTGERQPPATANPDFAGERGGVSPPVLQTEILPGNQGADAPRSPS